MQVAREHGLAFNGEKCAIKQTLINFLAGFVTRMVHTQTPPRLLPFTTCPAPDMPSQLHKFLGMVTYLSPFVPSLSSFTAPLHGLLKKDVEFTWNETYQDDFELSQEPSMF